MKIELNIILSIIFISMSFPFLGCSSEPGPSDFRYKLELPDKPYDLSLYRDKGNVYAPDYCDIYMDFRDGNFKKIYSFNLNDFSFKMIRYDKSHVAFIKKKRREKIAIADTVFFKLAR